MCNHSAGFYFLFEAVVTSWKERHVSTAGADVKDEVQKWNKISTLASATARQQVLPLWKKSERVVPDEGLLLKDLY